MLIYLYKESSEPNSSNGLLFILALLLKLPTYGSSLKLFKNQMSFSSLNPIKLERFQQ